MRSVVVLAVIMLCGSVLAGCGSSAAEPTSTPAAAATAAASPTQAATATAASSPTPLATTTVPAGTAGSGQITFAGMPEGESASAIYLVGSDGSGLHAIWTWETAGSHAVYLVWSPDGRQLAFFGHDAGAGSTGLYVLDVDHGSLTHLLEVGLIFGPAVWSADGTQLYVSLPPSALGAGGIWVVPADGSADPTLIAESEMGAMLTVSPDGQKIAATVSIGGPPQLAVMSVDDPQTRVVVDELMITSFPAWSPDSRQVAFIGQPPDASSLDQLYVVNADGTQLSQLTDHLPPEAIVSRSAASNPRWSPDGKQIAYTVHHVPTEETQHLDVHRSSVDASQTNNLTNDPEYVDYGPRWSPDGREIAFVSLPADAWVDASSGEPSSEDIRVIMADGTNPRTVVANVQFENFMELSGLPVWRPTAQ